MTRTFFFLILTVVLPALAQTNQPDKMQVVQMTLSPAAQPQPALKYQLLPPIMEQTPGNAVPLYATAIQLTGGLRHQNNEEFLRNLLETPLNKLPPFQTVEERLALDSAARYAAMASRRDKCDWDRPISSEGKNTLLPDLGPMRNISRYIALQARLQIAKGDFDAAIHTLQTGFSMARHTADDTCWVTNAVGIAMGNLMVKRVEEFIQVPGAPNLYWALTSLPNPFINLNKSMQHVALLNYQSFPWLLNLETKPFSPQEYQTLINGMARQIESMATKQTSNSPLQVLTAKIESGIKKDYPEAKRYLLAHGKSPNMVEALPVSQTVLIYYLRIYEQERDELFKWVNVPYWQGRERMQKAEQRIKELEGQMKNNFFLQDLAFSSPPYYKAVQLNRQIAALRCIEAIRMYAADHNGKLPTSLNDITEVPLPIDPVTGRPFIYSANENKAVLETPAPPGEKADTGKRYEITLMPPK